MVMIQRIYENDVLYNEIVSIDKPVFSNTQCFTHDEFKLLSSKNLLSFMDYSLKLLKLNNDDLTEIVTKMMIELIPYTEEMDTDYKDDVMKMRENDKQKKYNQKDKMGDDERLLYLMLEKVGYVPEMEQFSNAFEKTETPEAFNNEAQDTNNNPEYSSYLGENAD